MKLSMCNFTNNSLKQTQTLRTGTSGIRFLKNPTLRCFIIYNFNVSWENSFRGIKELNHFMSAFYKYFSPVSI